ncbi:hypothetical protein B0H13DRAFT_2322799 [Mycena leptocephala]|nr:hypothetical protein B0H13DRAFT_2322799 [Mycena leptocephala]
MSAIAQVHAECLMHHTRLSRLVQYASTAMVIAAHGWAREGPANILRERTASATPEVAAEQYAYLTVVGRVSADKCYVGPVGSYNRRFKDPLEKGKYTFMLEKPVADGVFAAAWDDAICNLRQIESGVCDGRSQHFFVQDRDQHRLRFTKFVFEIKSAENPADVDTARWPGSRASPGAERCASPSSVFVQQPSGPYRPTPAGSTAPAPPTPTPTVPTGAATHPGNVTFAQHLNPGASGYGTHPFVLASNSPAANGNRVVIPSLAVGPPTGTTVAATPDNNAAATAAPVAAPIAGTVDCEPSAALAAAPTSPGSSAFAGIPDAGTDTSFGAATVMNPVRATSTPTPTDTATPTNNDRERARNPITRASPPRTLLPLFCLHASLYDDVIPAPSRDSATHAINALNTINVRDNAISSPRQRHQRPRHPSTATEAHADNTINVRDNAINGHQRPHPAAP